MAKLDKNWTTIGGVLLIAFLSAIGVQLVFMPHIRNLQKDIQRESKTLEEGRALLAKRQSLQAEWEEKKSFFNPGHEPEEVLNTWVKALLSSAQAQTLTLEKLEPAGIKTGPDGKHLSVYISYQGDIRKLVKFVYQLIDKDPLARVESLDVTLEESSKILSFELMLGKIIQ